MSASREKKVRSEQRGNEPRNKSKDKSGAGVGGAVMKNLGVVAIVLAVLILAGLFLYGLGLPQRAVTAVTVDGENISVAEFNYFYTAQKWDFMNSNSWLFDYGIVDPYTPMSKQAYYDESGDMWSDYIMNLTMDKLRDMITFCKLAESEGVELTQWDRDTIEREIEGITEYAYYYTTSFNRALTDAYGKGVNEEVIRKCMERELLASRYEIYNKEKLSYSASRIQEYYDENSNQFDRVDYRSVSFAKKLSDEEFDAAVEAGEDPEALVQSPIGEMQAQEKTAYDKCAAFLGLAEMSPGTFRALADALNDPDDQDHDQDEDDEEDNTLRAGVSYYESGLMDWLFDPARKDGDIELIDDGHEFVAALFLSRDRSTDATVTMRHIFVSPQSDNESAWSEAKTRADNILSSVQGVGDDEFARKADSDSDDRIPGGLFKEITSDWVSNTFTNEEVEEWLFDSARKDGDVTLLEGPVGYHVLYFVSAGRPLWQVNVENYLRDTEYNDFRNTVILNHGKNPERKNFGLSMVTEI